MKRYILFFTFIFAVLSSATAQKDCSVRPIGVYDTDYNAVNLPHNPCEQVVEIYMMLKANPDATVNWQVVQSEMSDIPAEGWIIVDHNDHTMAGGTAGFEYTEPGPNGKTYFAAAIRSGRKAGVIKATVNSELCGDKVATLAVRPGTLDVTITEGECIDTEKTFTANAVPSKQPNSVTGYIYTWTYPADWVNTEDPSAIGTYTTTDDNTLTLITSTEPGVVSVDVVALYKGNNGQGVGNANCDFGTASILAEPCDEGIINPLAAELISFTGKTTASGIELAWSTASEKDNDRFEVQHSTDGSSFKVIGTVKGAGNSSTALSYSFTDKRAPKGTNYYRLNMIEPSGKFELSNVIALENSNTTTTGITLHPNPATGDNLTITVNGASSNNRDFIISITDINGRKAFEQKISATTGSDEINLSLNKLKISKGLYMVKILGENIVETQKLLVR